MRQADRQTERHRDRQTDRRLSLVNRDRFGWNNVTRNIKATLRERQRWVTETSPSHACVCISIPVRTYWHEAFKLRSGQTFCLQVSNSKWRDSSCCLFFVFFVCFFLGSSSVRKPPAADGGGTLSVCRSITARSWALTSCGRGQRQTQFRHLEAFPTFKTFHRLALLSDKASRHQAEEVL